jgi:hypothetical protein
MPKENYTATFDATILSLGGSDRPSIRLGLVELGDPHWRVEVDVQLPWRMDEDMNASDFVSTPKFRPRLTHDGWGHSNNSQTCGYFDWYGNGRIFKRACYELASSFYAHWGQHGASGLLYARWQLDRLQLQEQARIWRAVLTAYDGSGDPDFYPYEDPADSNLSEQEGASRKAYQDVGSLTRCEWYRRAEYERTYGDEGEAKKAFIVKNTATVRLAKRRSNTTMPWVTEA